MHFIILTLLFQIQNLLMRALLARIVGKCTATLHPWLVIWSTSATQVWSLHHGYYVFNMYLTTSYKKVQFNERLAIHSLIPKSDKHLILFILYYSWITHSGHKYRANNHLIKKQFAISKSTVSVRNLEYVRNNSFSCAGLETTVC